MKRNIVLSAIILLVAFNALAQKVKPNDLKILEGTWSGTLIYLDYTSNKLVTMPANNVFQQSKDNPNIYFRSISYSKEPKANEKDSMVISKDGAMLDDYKIISNRKLKDGSIEIIGEKRDADGNDNKQATIRRTFTINSTSFINKKEVKFDGTNEWIVRHTYSFMKSGNTTVTD